MNNIMERKKRQIDIMKAIAIVSVVCAHISVVPDNFSQTSQYVCVVLNEIGAIGVGIFFFVSGWLFSMGKSRYLDFISYWKNKFTSIGIPWIISATLVYMYVWVRKGGTFVEYISSCLGYLSSYWYLSVLFIIYFMYWFISRNRYVSLISIVLVLMTLISALLRGVGVIPQNVWGVYLNVFNWTGFFAAGYMISENKIYSKQVKYCGTLASIAFAVCMTGILILPVLGYQFSYFAVFYVPLEFLIIFSTYLISDIISNREHKYIELLGKMAFSIYLYNDLLWAGLVVAIGNKFDCWPFLLLRPIVVLVMVIIELWLGRLFFSKFHKEEMFNKLVGLRRL